MGENKRPRENTTWPRSCGGARECNIRGFKYRASAWQARSTAGRFSLFVSLFSPFVTFLFLCLGYEKDNGAVIASVAWNSLLSRFVYYRMLGSRSLNRSSMITEWNFGSAHRRNALFLVASPRFMRARTHARVFEPWGESDFPLKFIIARADQRNRIATCTSFVAAYLYRTKILVLRSRSSIASVFRSAFHTTHNCGARLCICQGGRTQDWPRRETNLQHKKKISIPRACVINDRPIRRRYIHVGYWLTVRASPYAVTLAISASAAGVFVSDVLAADIVLFLVP